MKVEGPAISSSLLWAAHTLLLGNIFALAVEIIGAQFFWLHIITYTTNSSDHTINCFLTITSAKMDVHYSNVIQYMIYILATLNTLTFVGSVHIVFKHVQRIALTSCTWQYEFVVLLPVLLVKHAIFRINAGFSCTPLCRLWTHWPRRVLMISRLKKTLRPYGILTELPVRTCTHTVYILHLLPMVL